jgi:hypothetical protein
MTRDDIFYFSLIQAVDNPFVTKGRIQSDN